MNCNYIAVNLYFPFVFVFYLHVLIGFFLAPLTKKHAVSSLCFPILCPQNWAICAFLEDLAQLFPSLCPSHWPKPAPTWGAYITAAWWLMASSPLCRHIFVKWTCGPCLLCLEESAFLKFIIVKNALFLSLVCSSVFLCSIMYNTTP